MLEIRKLSEAWMPLSEEIYVPHSEHEYEKMVRLLDALVDEVGENENHPLASLMELLSIAIENYEDKNVVELEEN